MVPGWVASLQDLIRQMLCKDAQRRIVMADLRVRSHLLSLNQADRL